MTDAIGAIAHMTGRQPSTKPGGLHVADQYYFRRIEAIEFTIAHDDGRNPQELHQADIVLLGVSRSSKDAHVHLPVAAGLQSGEHPPRSHHRASGGARAGRPHAGCSD